ncbi:MAG: hypothetical protein J2P29_15480, partial [Actinobacteria bacterium]|nr:hypothetical protein [Actinomycetota bacterium]
MAGDVATAGKAGPDVTQELPTADDRVTSAGGMPASAPVEHASAEPSKSGKPGQPGAEGTGVADVAAPDHPNPDPEAGQRSGGRRTGAGRRNTGGDGKHAARSATGRGTRRVAQPVPDAGTGQGGTDLSSGPTSVRRRLARLGAPRGAVNPVLEPLIRTVRTTHPKADIRLIERAYEAAAAMHAGQSRRS